MSEKEVFSYYRYQFTDSKQFNMSYFLNISVWIKKFLVKFDPSGRIERKKKLSPYRTIIFLIN